MCSFGLKGGTGTSSRTVPSNKKGSYTVGVLVQANHGVSIDLIIDGVNVGRTLYKEGYTKPWFPDPSTDESATKLSEGRDGDGR